jgi:hypothetical protein
MTALVLEAKALTADDLYTPEDEARLAAILRAGYGEMLKTMHLLVAAHLDLDPAAFRLDDPSTRAMLAQAGHRVVGISSTTREALAALLQEGQEAGLTTFQIQESIASLFEVTWKNRPEVVARTEIGEAQRLSAIDRYGATGLVDRVFIIDGEDDAPCAQRNGTTVPLDKAPGLAHPQCTLTLVPVLREPPAPAGDKGVA